MIIPIELSQYDMVMENKFNVVTGIETVFGLEHPQMIGVAIKLAQEPEMTSELNHHQAEQKTNRAIKRTNAKTGKDTSLLWTKMLEKRYYSTHERIEMAQRYYKICMEKKKLMKNGRNATLATKKNSKKGKLYLKYLTERPTLQFPLNIGRDIRIWDYIFPFDTTYKNSNENHRIPQLLLGGIMQIKRLTKFIYSK
jgi:outer membrane protein assembly factor BamE (lipoprotein component of BamABCDE complex)